MFRVLQGGAGGQIQTVEMLDQGIEAAHLALVKPELEAIAQSSAVVEVGDPADLAPEHQV